MTDTHDQAKIWLLPSHLEEVCAAASRNNKEGDILLAKSPLISLVAQYAESERPARLRYLLRITVWTFLNRERQRLNLHEATGQSRDAREQEIQEAFKAEDTYLRMWACLYYYRFCNFTQQALSRLMADVLYLSEGAAKRKIIQALPKAYNELHIWAVMEVRRLHIQPPSGGQFEQDSQGGTSAVSQSKEKEQVVEQSKESTYDQEKTAWIASQGSKALRAMVAAGYNCDLRYARERAKKEFPGYELLEGNEWTLSRCDEPSVEAFQEAQRVKGRVVIIEPEYIPELQMYDDDDIEDEGILINGFLGKYNLCQSMNVLNNYREAMRRRAEAQKKASSTSSTAP